jgi:cysteine desulfurase
VTCQTEHKSVLEVFWELERRGHRVTYLGVDTQGHIDLDELDRTLDESPALVSLMAANNEIGTLHPIAEVASRCKARDLPFHTDATQVIGKIPLDLTRLDVGFASFSAHKIYGPKGVGALYASREVRHRLAPLLHGGAQERGLRSGTLNVPGCVGFGEACRILIEEGPTEAQRLEDHASFLAVKLEERVAPMAVNGPSERLPGNVNVRVEGVIGDALVAALPDVAIATGSACTSEVPTTSHVLRSIGLSDEEAESSIRLSVGRETTQEEISRAVELIGAAVDTQRSFAGVSA